MMQSGVPVEERIYKGTIDCAKKVAEAEGKNFISLNNFEKMIYDFETDFEKKILENFWTDFETNFEKRRFFFLGKF